MKQQVSLQSRKGALFCDNDTHIDEICLVTSVQIMDDGSFVQVRKFCHIVGFVEFGRVDLVNLMRIHFPLL